MDFYFWLISLLSPLVLIICFGVGLYSASHLNRNTQALMAYLLLCIAIDLFSRMQAPDRSNLFLIPWFSFFELLLFAIFYKMREVGVIVIAFSCLGLLYILLEVELLRNATVDYFQPYSRTVSTILIWLASMRYAIKLIQSRQEISQLETSLNIVILVYFFSQLVILLPLNYLVNSKSFFTVFIWCINLIIHIGFYLYIGLYLWKNGKHTKQLSSG